MMHQSVETIGHNSFLLVKNIERKFCLEVNVVSNHNGLICFNHIDLNN